MGPRRTGHRPRGLDDLAADRDIADRDIAYTTVMSAMDNLHRKGWRERERDGKAHRYRPTMTREEQLMMLLRSLSSAMPRLPLFRNAVHSVGRLVEMCADDTAARQYGRYAVLGGLVALAGQPHATGGALGAADTAALARAIRLAGPVGRGARLRQRLLLASTIAALIVRPAATSALCHS